MYGYHGLLVVITFPNDGCHGDGARRSLILQRGKEGVCDWWGGSSAAPWRGRGGAAWGGVSRGALSVRSSPPPSYMSLQARCERLKYRGQSATIEVYCDLISSRSIDYAFQVFAGQV